MTIKGNISKRFPFTPKPIPEQPVWEIGVFPYKSVNGVVVEWNSVVRRQDPGETRRQVVVLKPMTSPEAAQQAAEAWLRKTYGSGPRK